MIALAVQITPPPPPAPRPDGRKKNRPKVTNRQQQLVDAFNARYAEGAEVTYLGPDGHSPERGYVIAPAFMKNALDARVWVHFTGGAEDVPVAQISGMVEERRRANGWEIQESIS
jgi:hypothetical protein